MYNDCGQHGCQRGVRRHLQPCFPKALDGHGDQPSRGAGLDPVEPRAVTAQAAAGQPRQKHQGNDGRSREQQTTLRRELEVMIVAWLK